jgi:predicted amidohydrolase
VRVACLQYCPGESLEDNAQTVLSMAREAVAGGARFLLLPEYAAVLHGSGRVMRETAREEAEHPLVQCLLPFARETGTWILVGSVTVPVEEGRIANRSLLISGAGEVVARYDKIHMFDATLPTGRTIRESSLYQPGSEAVVAATPWGPIGLSICYDVRFPYLYRALANAGAVFLAVPAAFTAATGPLHWHALVRARAIENGCYVIAPATCGTHPGEHKTYGHSLVVDPMGKVIADGGAEPGIVYAEIDPEATARARGMLPSLEHTRAFSVTVTPG